MSMRVVARQFLVGIGAIYSAGAFRFWIEERRSQSLEAARSAPPATLHHPEATLALIRDGMERNDFSPRVGQLVERALMQLPSFYQPRAYEALYYANRLERPAETDEAFRAALTRFPANGRLHLGYARWLLMAPSKFPSVAGEESKAEAHIATALAVEPNLTVEALETLQRFEVPPEHWADIIPADVEAQRRLVAALAQGGYEDEARKHLRTLVTGTTRARYLRLAAYWALSWGAPELALEAVEKWKHAPTAFGEPHEIGLLEARAHMALGEMDRAYDVFRSTLDTVGPATSDGLKLLCGIGEEYRRLNRLVLAESIFTEANGYSPSSVHALLGLARIRRQRGDDVTAVEYYEKVLRIDPENAQAKNELGQLIVQRQLQGRS